MSGKNTVILLGAGRSGTTLVYKILSAHRQVGYLSNYQSRYPGWPIFAVLHRFLNYLPNIKRVAWFGERGNAYFNEARPWLKSIVPTPSEAESIYRYCGLLLTPSENSKADDRVSTCLAGHFDTLLRISGTRVLLTKRTANNRRISQLHQILPDAKYIHLVRDGRAVAYSLPRVVWWDDHKISWAGNKTPREWVAEGANPLEIAARNWVEDMRSIETGLSLLLADSVLTVGYERLLEVPREEIRRILDFMGVDETYEHSRFVDSLALAPRKEAWRECFSAVEKALVTGIQHDVLARWGYLEQTL